MMTENQNEPTVTCYVNEDGKTNLKCPGCDTLKRIDASKYMFSPKPFKAKCKCGTTFHGRFEFRRHYRKKVRLAGHYIHKNTNQRGDILVENLSIRGVGFTCMDRPQFEVGDNIEITFWLDNPKSSKIILWVEIKNISGHYIGTLRRDTQLEQPDLGFYMQG
jgi:hypothetical protein